MNNYKLTSDILIQTIDNEAVVVSPTQGMITTINESGSLLLSLIKEKGHISYVELINVLQKEYDIPKEQVEQDVEQFLSQMKENKILEEYVA